MSKLSLRSIARSIREQPVARLVPWGIDRVAARRTHGERDSKSVLVVVATGRGNIGDQAMLDAVLNKLDGLNVTLVGEDSGAFESLDSQSVATVVIDGLLNGAGLRRFRAHRRYAQLASRSRHVVVIGADLMDGLYNPRKSVARLSLLRTAVATGATGRVTGFSWPPTPARTVLSPIRSLSKSVKFYLRDPQSYQRFSASGAQGLLTSDVVFSDDRRTQLPDRIAMWLNEAHGEDKPYAVVNISGLIEKRLAQGDEYVAIVQRLRQRGSRIVFLPHVVREIDGDSVVTREFFARHGQPGDLHITELLRPSQVRELARDARVVVTGRMHLAIMSLSQGTPAITLATQGKVEGLYSMFDLNQFAVDPSPGFGDEVAERIDQALQDDTGARIRDALPEVVSRANLNFDGLSL